MKVGLRTPSPKKMVKAKTTGRVKRAAKKAVNPVYGKKYAGFIKDPERAVKNKIYHKLTVDPLDPIKHPSGSDTTEYDTLEYPKKKTPGILILLALVSIFCSAYAIYMQYAYHEPHVFVLIIGIIALIIYYKVWRKNAKS